MSQPFIKGETLYKAIWSREAMNPRIMAGKVALADQVNLFVSYGEGGGESLLQANPDGWCHTQDEALGILLSRLTRSSDYINHDLLRVKARILRVNKLRDQLAGLGA
ncbi:MAG: hypothetical protein KKA55_01970 [Proteobacteria bacterium]|nr:hypothetical protein [Pseudomonadota bacterium]MBU1594286.1 hypothetical protein [Pseudomonadota bacterium]